MEYFLCRAMEITRLSPDRLFSLQSQEEVMGRCLMPWEIQDKFDLPNSKETWRIPAKESLQEQHTLNLKNQFRKLNLYPRGGDVYPSNVEEVHEFDDKVRLESRLDFVFHGGTERKNLKDELESK